MEIDNKNDASDEVLSENIITKNEQKKRLKVHGFKTWVAFFEWIGFKDPNSKSSNYSNPDKKPELYIDTIIYLLDLLKKSAEMYSKIKDRK